MRVLLVEDDKMIAQAVMQSLKDAAYAVDWLEDGAAAITSVQAQDYGIILLDLGLPNKDGIEVLRWLRANKKNVPVLIVTARDSLESRVLGLDLGADDYLLKPFELNELLARIRAIVRRYYGKSESLMSNGVVSLNPVTKIATADSSSYLLTAREFALLHALLLRPGAILSRAELEERIYGWNEEVESNAVEFLIHGLRKKLGTQVIKNVRGMGWMVSQGE